MKIVPYHAGWASIFTAPGVDILVGKKVPDPTLELVFGVQIPLADAVEARAKVFKTGIGNAAATRYEEVIVFVMGAAKKEIGFLNHLAVP